MEETMTKEWHGHTFAVCAYKDSPYLDECLKSLESQTLKTKVIVCTSTPSEYIRGLADKYGLPYFVRDGKSDIGADWNFAYDSAHTKYVTIAHQDDVYLPDYAENLKKETDKSEDSGMAPVFYFTDYLAYKDGTPVRDVNSRIRRFLRFPLKVKSWSVSEFIKRRFLSMGNPICCPTVTYNKEITGENLFTSRYKFNIDWDTFLKLSSYPGRFLYFDKVQVYYRVHPGATSAEFIRDSKRAGEDTIMFAKFWPMPIAKFIMIFYKASYKTYGRL